MKNPNNPVILSKRQDFRSYGIEIKFEDEALVKIAELAAGEKTGARGLVSAIEKTLIPFEKNLPSTNIRRLVVTPQLVDNPEAELAALKDNPDDSEILSRFQKAADKELEHLKTFIAARANQIEHAKGLTLYDVRIEIIANIYLSTVSDINTAVEDFMDLYNQIKAEESTLPDKIEVDITFDDSAIDELIRQAIESEKDAGSLAFQLAKKLEYGLKLVRDRTGMDTFNINGEAVRNMESYINGLVKEFYRHEYERYSGPDRNDKSQ